LNAPFKLLDKKLHPEKSTSVPTWTETCYCSQSRNRK